MAMEREFIEKGMRRSRIDEFLAKELERAGYGGMDLARTPMGTEITLKAEKPGMVIGKGGKNIRQLTDDLEAEFDLEDLQIDVQEIDEPDLNARVVADKLANALERGWYFRDAGRTTLSRIMESGALGAEIIFSGKVTGARSRVEKFKDGYVKHCGEPAEEIVDRGQATAVMKLGTIGVQVDIIPPDADLVDQFEVMEDADVEHLLPEGVAADDVEVEEADTEGVAEAAAAEAEEIAEEAEEPEEAPEPAGGAVEETETAEPEEAEAGAETEAPEPAATGGGEAPASAGAEEAAAADEPGDEAEVDVEVEEADAVPVEELEEEEVDSEAEEAEETDDEADEPEETEAEDEQSDETQEEPDETSDDTDDEDEGPAVPDSREDLEELSYRELQLLAKEADIKANLATEELVDELADEHDLEGS